MEEKKPQEVAEGATKPSNFIRTIIDEDLKKGKNDGRVVTRFPPEPNGYLHIGHAKSICLNFGLARDYKGKCHLRFDDTNPCKEDVEYEDSIQGDVKWLGFDWGENFFHASDYFLQLYEYAVDLIKQGKAYVCSLSADEMRAYRGTLKEPGKNSPYRDRSVEENLDLFERMKNGEFEEGSHVLRAKIDMASPNLNMRDPVIYRIRKEAHHRTGNQWVIYPMYDYTHCISDALERITHSICTLEFEDHRPLYDWVLDQLDVPCHPRQIEFARLNINYTVLSKRRLIELVEGGHVSGWDDPRMPTIVGFRRRGYTPASIRNFCDRVGVAKKDSCVDMGLLEFCVREDLDRSAPRAMGVLQPLKLVIDNYPEGQVEEFEVPCHPQDPAMGTRKIPFSREVYIEQDDFMEDPPKKFFRLGPGREVRLRYGYIVKCVDYVKDETTGEIKEVHCTYDPDTLGAAPQDGRKVKGIIHWVSAAHAVAGEVRLYDRLFVKEDPTGDKSVDYKTFLNPDSLQVLENCQLEPSLAGAAPESRFQFERLGYFCADIKDFKPERPVFNRTVTLRDTWAKIDKKDR
ncbi:MAG: glutamine--tRNA ligase/YqeY domain fusion protein [Deltaproteobacteria bacterium]|nr:glutamine--tRNA ligase/YqeY domain fusion protein [Deltaproteobacteria bacterium]